MEVLQESQPRKDRDALRATEGASEHHTKSNGTYDERFTIRSQTLKNETKMKSKKMRLIDAAIIIVNQMMEFLPDEYREGEEITLPIKMLESYKRMLNKTNENHGRKRHHAHILG